MINEKMEQYMDETNIEGIFEDFLQLMDEKIFKSILRLIREDDELTEISSWIASGETLCFKTRSQDIASKLVQKIMDILINFKTDELKFMNSRYVKYNYSFKSEGSTFYIYVGRVTWFIGNEYIDGKEKRI